MFSPRAGRQVDFSLAWQAALLPVTEQGDSLPHLGPSIFWLGHLQGLNLSVWSVPGHPRVLIPAWKHSSRRAPGYFGGSQAASLPPCAGRKPPRLASGSPGFQSSSATFWSCDVRSPPFSSPPPPPVAERSHTFVTWPCLAARSVHLISLIYLIRFFGLFFQILSKLYATCGV